MNKYKITVSTKAREQLLHHTAFIAKVSKDAAKRLVASFKETTLSLEEMPKRCPWFNRDYIPYNKYRYCIFEKRYALIFQKKEDIVFEDTGIKARKGEGYYRITWADAKVEGLPDDWNFDDVVKTHDLSQGQVLWLMAEDCNRNRRRAQANKA